MMNQLEWLLKNHGASMSKIEGKRNPVDREASARLRELGLVVRVPSVSWWATWAVGPSAIAKLEAMKPREAASHG